MPSAGGQLTLNVNIRNQGDKRAESTYIAYYIDNEYRGNHYVGGIDAGATATSTFMWTTEADSHIVKVVADMENTILESNEDNNEYTVTFPAPDLVIKDITWSPENPV